MIQLRYNGRYGWVKLLCLIRPRCNIQIFVVEIWKLWNESIVSTVAQKGLPLPWCIFSSTSTLTLKFHFHCNFHLPLPLHLSYIHFNLYAHVQFSHMESFTLIKLTWVLVVFLLYHVTCITHRCVDWKILSRRVHLSADSLFSSWCTRNIYIYEDLEEKVTSYGLKEEAKL